jgi:hypothetical protein
MAKYEPLHLHLKKQHLKRVRMSFAQIEKLLGEGLPPSASAHRAWWANEAAGQHVQARAWLDAGFRVDDVDLDQGAVKFSALDSSHPSRVIA